MYIYNIHIYIYYIYYIYIYIHTCTLYIYVNSCNNTYFNIACDSSADVMHSLLMVCTRDWKKIVSDNNNNKISFCKTPYCLSASHTTGVS